MTAFSLEALRRYPDVEAPNLFASDASDRLILDEASAAIAGAPAGGVAVIGDRYGALTLGAAALHGATAIRTHQDALIGERALAANADRLGHSAVYTAHGLDDALVSGARVVLLQLPRSLDELDEIAGVVATYADPRVQLFAGGRVKHMSRSMNDVLGRWFGVVEAGLARQKSRLLAASEPRPADRRPAARRPASEQHADLGLTVCAHGGAFAGRGSEATRTRDFCRAKPASTTQNQRPSTSFIERLMCLTRPPANSWTCGSAKVATTPAISSSSSSDLGSCSRTTRAPETSAPPSPCEVYTAECPSRSALSASARSPVSASWCVRIAVAPCSAAAPRVRAP